MSIITMIMIMIVIMINKNTYRMLQSWSLPWKKEKKNKTKIFNML